MRRTTHAILVTAAAGLLLCEAAHAANAGDDALPQNESRGAAFSLIDNSHADSWLEVDRTGNAQAGSGTAGSDHDGSEIRNDQPAAAPPAARPAAAPSGAS